jgi:hypothetical protein
MTWDEFFVKYVAAVEKRLAAHPNSEVQERLDTLKGMGVSGLAQFPLLDDVPVVSAGVGTGACDYKIQGKSFCASNVTLQECNDLGGTFRGGGTCPAGSHWVTALSSATLSAPDHDTSGAESSPPTA